MKEFINSSSEIYCDYTIFLNESFELFCKNNFQFFKDNGVMLNIPQPVVDEMKAVPMSRIDDYVLCCQGLERIDKVVSDGIAVVSDSFDGVEYSEDYFYRLCKNSCKDIIVITNDIALITELADICISLGRHESFFKALEIEENGMLHRLR